MHVINKFPILFYEQSKRSSILDGVIKGKVDTLTMLECMDDNIEVFSSSSAIVGSQYIEGSSLHVILDLNGVLLATNFKIVWRMKLVTKHGRPLIPF